ncbi:uncharacterized protein LOC135487986 [Lineus longissimus]|uniref:uncharacterized protein LOC135487986 n=1 Tax=Lineus longissimus TaxID=88925 RepID=UPI002B4E3D7F
MPRGMRGRGRGGRGRGRGRGGRGNYGATSSVPTTPSNQKNEDLDINKDVKGFFVGTASPELHYEAQEENRFRYAAAMCLMDELGIEMSQNARVRALAAAIARSDKELINSFLSNTESFGFVEVLKAMQLLDSARQIRFYEKKMKRLQMQSGKVKAKTLGTLKSNIDNLNANKPKNGSASGASCKYIREWARRLSKENLEFFALHMPTEPWKKLADIVHFNSKEDFPNLPWFLPYCFGVPAPEDSVVHKCKVLNQENVSELVLNVDIPFSHIKQYKDKLTPEAKVAIVKSTKKLDTIIWNYEDLMCPPVDQVIASRLATGESMQLPYGKLMERLLTMKMYRETTCGGRYDDSGEPEPPVTSIDETKAPFYKDLVAVAEKKLKELSLPLEPPILVIGDMSSSMDVAIRTATIISSLLTAITSAKLVFFNHTNMDAPKAPSNVEEVLQMAVDIQASGSTAPAASLWPIYESKTVYKTILMVTDEEENTACPNGDRWTPLFKKYHAEVYPAKMVFVSFLSSQHSSGYMVDEMRRSGFNPIQFKLDGKRPDLTKLDTLFGLLSADTKSFEDQLASKLKELETEGLMESFQKLSVKNTLK